LSSDRINEVTQGKHLANAVLFGTVQYKSTIGTLHKTRFALLILGSNPEMTFPLINPFVQWWKSYISTIRLMISAD